MNEPSEAIEAMLVHNHKWDLRALLSLAAERGASDLILVADAPPCMSVDGAWHDVAGEPTSADQVKHMLDSVLDERHRDLLERCADVDLSIDDHRFGRCRINVHRQKRALAAAIRFVPRSIPDLATLHLPDIVAKLADLPRGLVLVTGGAGTGKSTTLAAIIDRLNHTRRAHVITLEDPIEYSFVNNLCIIEQREIGVDAPTFASALRHVVRQIPDIIMIGEMRDLDTIAAALTAAETGHLVFATLHTMSAAQTVERIIDVFDSGQQPYVRTQLATCLQAVVCQTLFVNEAAGGRVPATEVMVRTAGVARAIRDSELHLIQGMIETGRQQGMHTLDASIADLVAQGLIDREVALARAADPDQMQKRMARMGAGSDRLTAGRPVISTPSAISWR